MKCNLCHKNEAHVHFKHMSNGEVKELYVCEACAAAQGFSMQAPLSLSQFLFGPDAGLPKRAGAPARERQCAACRMPLSEFRKRSRLGCGECYETFSDEVAPLLRSMHKGMRHEGRAPAAERIRRDVWNLRKQLKDAVASQRFEDAAALRDRIKALTQ